MQAPGGGEGQGRRPPPGPLGSAFREGRGFCSSCVVGLLAAADPVGWRLGGRELCLGGVEAQSATLLCHPPRPLLGHFKTPGSRKLRPPGGNGRRGGGGPAALRSCRATPRLGRHAAPSAPARPFHLLPKTCCLEGSL